MQLNLKIFRFLKNTLQILLSKMMIVPWVLFAGAFFITILIWQIVKSQADKNSELYFSNVVSDTEKSIIDRLKAYEQVLKGASGLFSASQEVTYLEWHNYITALKIEENYKGIQGIGFSKYFKKSELPSVINFMKSQGFPVFRIFPEFDRNEYTSIIFLEPADKRNVVAIGFDMFTEAVRNEAMAKARDLNTTTISGKVTLVQEIDSDVQNGFLMYLPIYKGNPITLEQRRNSLIGFVYAPFRIKDFLKEIISPDIEVAFDIYDSDSLDQSKIIYSSNEDLSSKADFSAVRKIKLNNHLWTIKFSSLPSIDIKTDTQKPLYVLIAGIAFSLLIFIITVFSIRTKQLNTKLEQILGSSGEGIFGLDTNGRCTFVNNSASRLLKYLPNELIKKNIIQLIHSKNSDGSIKFEEESGLYQSLLEQKTVTVYEDFFLTKQNEFFPVSFSSYPIIENGTFKGSVVVFNDISQKKQTMKELELSLKEKTVLLKEVHHRVKNNLQIITSLLNLQSNYLNGKNIQNAFRETQNRITSMALMHERLYQTNNMSSINFEDYIKDIVSNLIRSFQGEIKHISVNYNIVNENLSIDVAIILGIILTEIISNSLKHAFKSIDEPEINVIMFSNINTTTIKIKDNGVGFPADFDYLNNNSLGLHLVFNLIEQIDGTISTKNSLGTEFVITFPKAKF